MSEVCPWCGGSFAEAPDGDTHAYMLSSPGCWAAYGELLAREYSNAVLFGAVHRLSVDAFAIQHPGDASDRRAVQSFWIHGASLWMVKEQGRSQFEATGALKQLAKGVYPPLPDETPEFSVTHADVLAAPVEKHRELVLEWSATALAEWNAVHEDFARIAARAD